MSGDRRTAAGGRKPVETVAVPETRRDDIVARVRAACAAGRQAYWVGPLIEESETLELQTATDTYEALRAALPDIKISLVHGRLKSAEKEKIMAAFKAGQVQLLVATTVIEVGVDVPNASLMIIENAERLGCRSCISCAGASGAARESHCVLLYQPPLGDMARTRLSAFAGPTTVSRSPGAISSCAARASCSARAKPGCRRFTSPISCATTPGCHACTPPPSNCGPGIRSASSPIVRRWLGSAEQIPACECAHEIPPVFSRRAAGACPGFRITSALAARRPRSAGPVLKNACRSEFATHRPEPRTGITGAKPDGPPALSMPRLVLRARALVRPPLSSGTSNRCTRAPQLPRPHNEPARSAGWRILEVTIARRFWCSPIRRCTATRTEIVRLRPTDVLYTLAAQTLDAPPAEILKVGAL